jgi:phage baseplate assembly protein W
MSTRADRYTQLQKIPDLFSDFLNDLTPHPITKDVTRGRNDQAVKQSIKNLVLTNFGERLFQPGIGCNVNRSLFEPNDGFLANDIEKSILDVIAYNEPRVVVSNVEVISSNQGDKLTINIVFSIINNPVPQNIDIILRRVR